MSSNNSKNTTLIFVLMVVAVITFTYVIINASVHDEIYDDIEGISLTQEDE